MTWLYWLLPFGLLQTALHEAAHALAAMAHGFTVTRFRPWPHRLESGRFVWGSVSWDGPVTFWTAAWPRVWNLTQFAVLPWVREPWAYAWLLSAVVDFSWNTIRIWDGWRQQTDAWRTWLLCRWPRYDRVRGPIPEGPVLRDLRVWRWASVLAVAGAVALAWGVRP